jgi:hypothetical protein
MIGEAIYIRVSDKKIKSDSHETWKCADAELQQQFRYFPYGECSDVPRLIQFSMTGQEKCGLLVQVTA